MVHVLLLSELIHVCSTYYVHMGVCMQVEARGWQSVFLNHSPPYFLRVSHWSQTSLIWPDQLVKELQGSTCVCPSSVPPRAGLQTTPPTSTRFWTQVFMPAERASTWPSHTPNSDNKEMFYVPQGFSLLLRHGLARLPSLAMGLFCSLGWPATPHPPVSASCMVASSGPYYHTQPHNHNFYCSRCEHALPT